NRIKNPPKRGITRFVRLQNTINRISNTTEGGELFNQAYYAYPDFTIFAIQVDNSFDFDKVISALKVTSLGGNRSTGCGLVELTSVEEDSQLKQYLQLTSNDGRGRFYTLSPTFPDTAFDYHSSLYDINIFAGKVDNFYERVAPVILKKRVLYLSKGSVLEIKKGDLEGGKKFYGGMAPVIEYEKKGGERITIYQYGYAFPLYVKG
ncbi:MAG: hypothetical protein ABDI07_10805, partial [Candidatus Kryptonium sp.]